MIAGSVHKCGSVGFILRIYRHTYKLRDNMQLHDDITVLVYNDTSLYLCKCRIIICFCVVYVHIHVCIYICSPPRTYLYQFLSPDFPNLRQCRSPEPNTTDPSERQISRTPNLHSYLENSRISDLHSKQWGTSTTSSMNKVFNKLVAVGILMEAVFDNTRNIVLDSSNNMGTSNRIRDATEILKYSQYCSC